MPRRRASGRSLRAPRFGLIQDCWHKCHRHEDLPIMDAPVVFLLNRPSDQPNEGIELFPPGFNDQLPGRPPPDNVLVRSWARSGRRICLRVQNHISQLQTQSMRRWSRVSTSCVQRAQIS
jgi:hypothetical protein